MGIVIKLEVITDSFFLLQLLCNVVKVESHACQNMIGNVPISKPRQIALCNCFRASHSKFLAPQKQDQKYFILEKTCGFLSLSVPLQCMHW